MISPFHSITKIKCNDVWPITKSSNKKLLVLTFRIQINCNRFHQNTPLSNFFTVLICSVSASLH